MKRHQHVNTIESVIMAVLVDDGFQGESYVTPIVYFHNSIDGGTRLASGEVTFYSFRTSSVLVCKISSLQG